MTKRQQMSARDEALAFRIWAYCEPLGWDVTSTDIAREMGAPRSKVAAVLARKGWTSRIRSMQSSNGVHRGHNLYSTDSSLDRVGYCDVILGLVRAGSDA